MKHPRMWALPVLLLASVLFTDAAFASVQISQDGTRKGEFRKINLTDGLAIDNDGNITVGTNTPDALTTTGDVTFRTSLLAGGRFGASSTIPSSSNGINPSTLPYSKLLKFIGNVAGETATLPAGTPGQLLAIDIGGCGPSGTWILSHTGVAGSGWTTITFDTKGDNVLLLYDATIGWFILNASGVTVNYPAA